MGKVDTKPKYPRYSNNCNAHLRFSTISLKWNTKILTVRFTLKRNMIWNLKLKWKEPPSWLNPTMQMSYLISILIQISCVILHWSPIYSTTTKSEQSLTFCYSVSIRLNHLCLSVCLSLSLSLSVYDVSFSGYVYIFVSHRDRTDFLWLLNSTFDMFHLHWWISTTELNGIEKSRTCVKAKSVRC